MFGLGRDWWKNIDLFSREWEKLSEETKKHKGEKGESCPKCGHPGEFIKTALCCPEHGVFGGF